MILARTLPTAVAPPTRQTGDANGKAPSDDAGTPFGGVLDQMSDQRGRPSRTPDGTITKDVQPSRTSPPALAAPALNPKTVPPASPDFALPTAAYGLPAAMPIAAAAPSTAAPCITFSGAVAATGAAIVASPADLAALFVGFSPAVAGKAAGAAAPETGTATSRTKNAGKAAPTPGDAAPASTAAAPAVVPLSNPFDLTPVAPLQPPTAEAAKSTTGQDLPAVATTATLAGQTAGAPITVDEGTVAADAGTSAVARGAAAPSRAHADDSKSDAFTSALAPIVRSVSVETQLAPAVSLQPMQQVIASVQKLAAAASSAAVDLPTAPAAPLQSSRTMTLVLEPPDLGTVTVRMQLRGDSLDLQLDVGNAQTLGLLSRDKDSLTAAMTSQDYQIGTLTMRASDTQTSSQGSDHGSRPQDQAAGGSQSGGDASQGGQASQGGSGLDSGSRQEQRGSRSQAMDDEIVLQRSAGVGDAAATSGLYI